MIFLRVPQAIVDYVPDPSQDGEEKYVFLERDILVNFAFVQFVEPLAPRASEDLSKFEQPRHPKAGVGIQFADQFLELAMTYKELETLLGKFNPIDGSR